MTTLATSEVADAPANGHHLKEKAAAARSAIANLACETKHFVGDRLTTLKTKSAEKAKTVDTSVSTFVADHPYKSLAIAAALGLTAGLLLKRR